MSKAFKYKLHHPPVFVCGVQRSGTTLLLRMLSQHPEFNFLPQETHYFPLLWNANDKLKRFGNSDDLTQILLDKLPNVNYGWTEAQDFLSGFCDALKHAEQPPVNTASLLRYTMHYWQELQQGPIRTGEKTPAHIYYALEILKEFPECKFVLMCRDPRAAALSELVKLEGNTRITRQFRAFNFIVRWATAIAISKGLATTQNAILIRYEDLIATPDATLEKVTSFLGLEMTSKMLEVGVTNSSFSDKKQEGIGFNIVNLDRWKTALDPATISLIEYHLAKEMKEMGYSLTGDTVDISKHQLLKQKVKLNIARKVCLASPARFHHLNRNKKYRFQ